MRSIQAWIPAVTLLLSALVFAVDRLSPLGYAVWLGYLLPLWFAPRARYAHYPVVLAGVCTLLIALDLAEGGSARNAFMSTVNRSLAIAVLWTMALLFERGARAGRIRQHLLQDLQVAHARLRGLSHRLLNSQETERRNLARDLHDEIGQALTALKLNLRALEDGVDPEAATQKVRDCLQITDQLIERIRNLAMDLRPSLLDELGLASALHWYVERQAERAGWEAELRLDEAGERIPPDLEVALFRITQEALTNAARHAGAGHVRLTLVQRDGLVELAVEDDGTGFDVEEGRARARSGSSLGLLGMEERVHLAGGTLELRSTPGKGTKIVARFPRDRRGLADGRAHTPPPARDPA